MSQIITSNQGTITIALCTLLIAAPTAAISEPRLPNVVITATPLETPLTVRTDPRQPRQPLPAQDGADILRSIIGFSSIRKGGTSGDPVFRGMAGSRLNILVDGGQMLGGCPSRMDPPTAYITPDSFDSVTVIKGPQTVVHGPGNAAGTVLFERNREVQKTGTRANLNLTAGSFGRTDALADAEHATEQAYVRGTATWSRAADYRDGDNQRVHSGYERWSSTLEAGLTPDRDNTLSLTYARSDGEAAYADRGMDGTRFDRTHVGLRMERRNISPLVSRIKAQLHHTSIDHVMDNFTLRTPPTMKMISNPERMATGGRVAALLMPNERMDLELGTDFQNNRHSSRSARGENARRDLRSSPQQDDARFRNLGVFGELAYHSDDYNRYIAGLRIDHWQARDLRDRTRVSTGGERRKNTLLSGFTRWERDLRSPDDTVYVGLGHAERFPDYWESIARDRRGPDSDSAFDTRTEKTTQLDVGMNARLSEQTRFGISAFYNHINDFILIDDTGTESVVRNIDARTWGLEASVEHALTQHWDLETSIAWVRGENRTDGRPLAQIPPLEARISVKWQKGRWAAGSLLRMSAAQNRVDPRRGSIAGQDIGTTAGFAVFSLNSSYHVSERMQLHAGVDNLFNRNYAEHLASGGAEVPGYFRGDRVNEPGRTIWLKAMISLD